jgi:hypothetical protein
VLYLGLNLRFFFLRAGQSRCSKAGSLELGDLSEAEAHGYLRAQGVGEKDAARVVEVTGGRLLHLLAALEALGQGDSVQGEGSCFFALCAKA